MIIFDRQRRDDDNRVISYSSRTEGRNDQFDRFCLRVKLDANVSSIIYL